MIRGVLEPLLAMFELITFWMIVWLFCAGFVCMGLQTNFRQLAPVLASGRPVVLYVIGQSLNLALTLAMASLTFGWLFRKAVEP